MSGIGIVDTKQLEQRLVLKESVIGASSLARCASKLSVLKTSPTDAKALESFLRELSLYKLEIEKSSRSVKCFDLQLEEYAALEASINDKMQEATEEIEQLQQELKQEKEVRAHRKELEDYAIIVNKHQRSSSTKRKIDEVLENMSTTKDTLAKVEGEIAVRLSQVDRLMAMVEELETKLNDDDQVEGNEDEVDRGDDRRGGRSDIPKTEDDAVDADNEGGDVGMETELEQDATGEDGELLG